MTRNHKFPYNRKLRTFCRALRKEGTQGEAILWSQLRARQLGYQFRRQVPIGEYIVDFYCHQLKLAVEVDGLSHRVDTAGRQDLARQQRLEALGIKFLRFTEGEVRRNIAAVIKVIAGYVNNDNYV